MSIKRYFRRSTLIMLTKEEHVYLVQGYRIGDVSHKYALDLFHEKCPIKFSQRYHSENSSKNPP